MHLDEPTLQDWALICTRWMLTVPFGLQDFMGFLHLGWDVATKADGDETIVVEETPAWAAVARRVNLNKPGLSIVRQTMAWQPLHMAAMSGDVDLIEELVSVSASRGWLMSCLLRRCSGTNNKCHLHGGVSCTSTSRDRMFGRFPHLICRSTNAICWCAASIPGHRCTMPPPTTR